MQSNFVRKKIPKKIIFMRISLVKHITINLNETCYQQKTMSIDGLIYILMAFGEIRSRFQTFEGIVDALSSLKTVFYMLLL